MLSRMTFVFFFCSCLDISKEERMEGSEPGDCTDLADNDMDGAFDCDDDGCKNSPQCNENNVSTGQPPIEEESPSDPQDNDNDGFLSNEDCNDQDPNTNPSAAEYCDGIDNNCDGMVDEGVLETYFEDNDGDTFGNVDSKIEACQTPQGYVMNSLDCNDNDATIYPWATEICNGLDNNCDDIIDNCSGCECDGSSNQETTGNGSDSGIPTDTGNTTAESSTLVQDLSPSFGLVNENTPITITGGPFDATTQVYFDSEEATIVSQSNNFLEVLSPTSSIEGSVDVSVSTTSNSTTLSSAFTYFSDASGTTGAIGIIEYQTLMGTYWPSGTSLNQGNAEIIFTEIPDLHYWEFSVSALDTCESSSFTYSGNVQPYDFQEPQIYLQSTLGSPITLYWDYQQSKYRSSTLSAGDLPNNTYFALLPFTQNIDGFEIPSFAKTSEPITISNPDLQGISPDVIEQSQEFTWTPSGASWIGITIAINNNPVNGSYADMIQCMVVDDGSFTAQGELFSQWISGRQIDIFFTRYVEHEVILPHNNSTGRMVGSYLQFGAGIAQ